MIFEPGEVRCEPILDQGRRLQQASIVAGRSVVRESAQTGRIPRCEIHLKRPPVGWHKLSTDGALCVDSGVALCGGGQTGLWSLSLINHIVDLIPRVWEVQIEHVLREGNKLTDGMVKIVLDNGFLCYRFLDPSDGVVSLFQLDSVE
ncbi:hypothetical protein V6N11_050373 [Hibiscus sabdariffa]|uniref:RNase H type-1 domain-containing protein n=1 Tax=Hibiscus sabdariffa TaxID=183260 RepID=A0ABR2T9S9_9ROSI